MGLTIRPIRTMMNHATTEVFFENMRVPADNLIGVEGEGFRYILSGMNAERILDRRECIGDAKWFIEQSRVLRARARRVRPAIGQNQGVQFSIARASDIGMRAAELMVREAAAFYEDRQGFRRRSQHGETPRRRSLRGQPRTCACRPMAASAWPKNSTSSASFAKTRLYTVAPISTNLILCYIAEHVLGVAAILLKPTAASWPGLSRPSRFAKLDTCGSSTFTSSPVGGAARFTSRYERSYSPHLRTQKEND